VTTSFMMFKWLKGQDTGRNGSVQLQSFATRETWLNVES
jgi:hypothetical protein